METGVFGEVRDVGGLREVGVAGFAEGVGCGNGEEMWSFAARWAAMAGSSCVSDLIFF